MSRAIQQHYIWRVHLEGFVMPNGQISILDKKKPNKWTQKPSEAFVRKNFYSKKIDGEGFDDTIESVNCAVETSLSDVLKKIRMAPVEETLNYIKDWDVAARKEFFAFILHTAKRTEASLALQRDQRNIQAKNAMKSIISRGPNPELAKNIEKMEFIVTDDVDYTNSEIIADHGGFKIISGKNSKIREAIPYDIKTNSLLSTDISGVNLLDGLDIAIITSACSRFILSDNPVIFIIDPTQNYHFFFTPISKDRGICFFGSKEIRPNNYIRHILMGSEGVSSINQVMLKTSKKYIVSNLHSDIPQESEKKLLYFTTKIITHFMRIYFNDKPI